MATTSVSKRIIRLPYVPSASNYSSTYADILNKMNSLKLAGTSVFIAISDRIGQEVPTIQFEVSLIPANDTTLQASFAAWEAQVFTATGSGGSEIGKILDTEVSTFTQGHA